MKKLYYIIVGVAAVLYTAMRSILGNLFSILIYEPLWYLYEKGKETVTTRNKERK